MRRRTFFAAIASFLFFTLIIPGSRIRSLFNRLKKPSPPGKYELDAASVIAEYIYPRDADPGALDLGIRNFFDIQFKNPYYQQHIPALKRFVRLCDETAQKSGYTHFLAADASGQKQILDAIVNGKPEQYPAQAKNDFNTLVAITLEGCFSNPVHGGNKNRQAWLLLNGSLKKEWFDV